MLAGQLPEMALLVCEPSPAGGAWTLRSTARRAAKWPPLTFGSGAPAGAAAVQVRVWDDDGLVATDMGDEVAA